MWELVRLAYVLSLFAFHRFLATGMNRVASMNRIVSFRSPICTAVSLNVPLNSSRAVVHRCCSALVELVMQCRNAHHLRSCTSRRRRTRGDAAVPSCRCGVVNASERAFGSCRCDSVGGVDASSRLAAKRDVDFVS